MFFLESLISNACVIGDLFDAILQSEEGHGDWLETPLILIEKMAIENCVQLQS